MKGKHIYCAIIALIVASCDKVLDDPLINSTLDIPETLSARTAEFNSQSSYSKSCVLYENQPENWDHHARIETRTYAQVDNNTNITENIIGEYFQYWSEGDAISVFFTTANLKYELQGYSEGTDTGVFTHVSGDQSNGMQLTSECYYGVYPYKTDTQIDRAGDVTYNFPNTQYYREDSYANGANGMLAIEPLDNTDNILEFKNFCCYLQLQLKVKGTEQRVVKQIELKAKNNDNFIAGDGKIYVSEDIETKNKIPYVKMQDSGSNSIILNCGEGISLSNTPTNFWFVLPAINDGNFIGCQFQGGFDINVMFTEGPIFRKSTTNTVSIRRNHIKPMAVLEVDSELDQDATIIYKYKNPITNTTSLPFFNNEDDKNFTGSNGELLDYRQEFNSQTNEWHVTFTNGKLMNIGNNVFDFGENYDLDYIIVNNESGINLKDHCFYNCSAESIEFYNSINVIESDAFGASDITNITINGDVTNINKSAFKGSSVKRINISGNITNINKSAFKNSEVIEVNITGNVFNIDESAFDGSDIEIINIAGSVNTIGESAFEDSAIKSVNIAGGVTNVGESAFSGCDDLSSISLCGVTNIGAYAFKYCESLSTAVFTTDDDTILSFGEGIFADCTSLMTVELNAKHPPIFIHDNSVSDGPYIFPSQTTIYVPSTEDYRNASYQYPSNNQNAKNEWPVYYGQQLDDIKEL